MQNASNSKGLYGIGQQAYVRTYLAGGSITAGQTVKLDVSKTDESRVKYVVQGDASALVIGVALEAASAEGEVRVAVGGYVQGVKTDGNVTSGAALIAGASGAVIVSTTNTLLPLIGVALEADDSTPVCDIYLFNLVP